jgi:hypothetical protein
MSPVIVSGMARITILIAFCREDAFIGWQLMACSAFYVFMSTQEGKTVGNGSMIKMGASPTIHIVTIGTGMRETG